MNDAPPRRVLVTGADGFVGRALCRALAARGREVLAVTRSPATIPGAARVLPVGDLVQFHDWSPLLEGVEGVAHLAALTHDGTRGANSARFTAVNVEVSRRLAQSARASGVAHFVYLSSIKAAGERSPPGRALSGDNMPAPEDDYGRSKLAAERAVGEIWRDGALIVLRPPLVYGAGQRGNLARLCAHLERGLPLPCASPPNRRSLVQVDNLADALVLALDQTPVGPRCYTLADAHVSGGELIRAVARALGVEARLWPLPAALLRSLEWAPRMGPALARLAEDLVVDAEAISRDLGWRPRVSFEAGIAAACAAWREAGR